MRHLLPIVLALVLPPLAGAQSLAQVRVEGALLRPGMVEVEVGTQVDGEPRRLDVHVLLAAGTTGADLVSLVAGRLESSGFHTHLGPVDQDADGRTLFVERALFVHLRLGRGLRGSLTSCEGPPTTVKISPGPEEGADLHLGLTAGTFDPARREHGVEELELTLAAGSSAARCAERLMATAAEASFASERPTPEFWRPLRLIDGSRLTGLTVSVANGWRVELDLRAPE